MTELQFIKHNPHIKKIDIARELGITPGLISKWISGKRRIPEAHRITLRFILTKHGYKP